MRSWESSRVTFVDSFKTAVTKSVPFINRTDVNISSHFHKDKGLCSKIKDTVEYLAQTNLVIMF